MRLSHLEIDDFGLIARASLEFADGFTVCTGETGSGKTMLLGALAFVLGERSSGDVVRGGTARARVALAVDTDAPLEAALADAGFPTETGEAALFTREMTPNGKSTARINGRLATAAQLRDAGERIVESIGQHEQQRLLSRAYQTDVLDAYGVETLAAIRAAVAGGYERARHAERELAEALVEAGRAADELAYARFAVRELDEAALEAGEDERLRERRDYLSNVERIATALSAAHELLGGGEASAVESTGAAATSVATVARFSSELDALATTLAGLQSELGDAAAALARALERSDFDAGELEAATARLDRIERLKKKYGGSIESALAARARLAETIERETTRGERETALRAEVERANAALNARASELTQARAQAARALETRVAEELRELAMPAARFSVALEALAEIGPNGAESVEFALSPNPGEPLRPLGRAASGGELSRVLLALVVVLAGRRERTALVFDEIDAGIGGATAAAVGTRLGTLARASQVLCVTHLAQIASWADRHYALRKREDGEATVVELVPLAGRRDVLEEIARMLSGTTAAVALDHAQTLVRDVRARKARTKLPA